MAKEAWTLCFIQDEQENLADHSNQVATHAECGLWIHTILIPSLGTPLCIAITQKVGVPVCQSHICKSSQLQVLPTSCSTCEVRPPSTEFSTVLEPNGLEITFLQVDEPCLSVTSLSGHACQYIEYIHILVCTDFMCNFYRCCGNLSSRSIDDAIQVLLSSSMPSGESA